MVDFTRFAETVAETARYGIDNIKAGNASSALDNMIGLEVLATMLIEKGETKPKWRRRVMHHEWSDDFAEQRILEKVEWLDETYPDGMIESIVTRQLTNRGHNEKRAYTFIIKVPA